MTRQLGLIGVPSSAGAHWPGQEKAPRALRDAGLVERLTRAGCAVVDHGDLPRVRWRPNRQQPRPHNLAAVVGVARDAAARVADALSARQTPLVLGGDCTVTVGVIAGFLRHGADPALLYVDGGTDLRTPATSRPGMLDSMGVAHMIGAAGTAAELSHLGPRVPLLPESRIVFFGYGPGDPNDPESKTLAGYAMPHYPAEQVQGRSRAAAGEALALVEGLAERFVVHFDVDVIDFMDFPVADVPEYHTGLTFAEAMACLRVFAASPRFGGLVVTEFNPDHADEEGALAADLAQGIADALAPPGTRGGPR
jgi:arginase